MSGCLILVLAAASVSCLLPPPTAPPALRRRAPGLDRHSVHIGNSSVQFNGEVWELRPQQRAHNWHLSGLIKGESSGMDPSGGTRVFIWTVCKQIHKETDNGVTHHNAFVLPPQIKGITCCTGLFSEVELVYWCSLEKFTAVVLLIYQLAASLWLNKHGRIRQTWCLRR